MLRTIIGGFLTFSSKLLFGNLCSCQYVLFMICGLAAKGGRKPCSREHPRGKKIYSEAQTTNYKISFIQSSLSFLFFFKNNNQNKIIEDLGKQITKVIEHVIL